MTITIPSRVFVGVLLIIALGAAIASSISTVIVLQEQGASCERGNVSRSVNRDQNAILSRLVGVVQANPQLPEVFRPAFAQAQRDLEAATAAQQERSCS